MPEPLRLTPAGWLREGRPWTPSLPFYAVVGDPIAHSLSPRMQAAALAERQLAHEYLALEVAADQLAELKARTAVTTGFTLAGFNVTAPHKEAVAALCDGRTDQARALGAVNTVRVEDGRWLGHNTDSGGLLAVLTQLWRDDAPPAVAVVLGTGGSARAAVDALLRWGVAAVDVRWHSTAGRDRFELWLGERGLGEEVSLAPLGADDELPPDEPCAWICCLAGGVSSRPFLPPAAGAAACLLVDVRYGNQLPAEAPPLGFSFTDGLPMLLMQGGLSFAWWFGPPVPWAAMHAALPSR
jgi:shikimate dehydrogenase